MMNIDRIKEIQQQTAYNESKSVQCALIQVWRECENEQRLRVSASVDINKQVEILKKTIDKLMITFDNENDKMDYILDIVNEYKRQMMEHYGLLYAQQGD